MKMQCNTSSMKKTKKFRKESNQTKPNVNLVRNLIYKYAQRIIHYVHGKFSLKIHYTLLCFLYKYNLAEFLILDTRSWDNNFLYLFIELHNSNSKSYIVQYACSVLFAVITEARCIHLYITLCNLKENGKWKRKGRGGKRKPKLKSKSKSKIP